MKLGTIALSLVLAISPLAAQAAAGGDPGHAAAVPAAQVKVAPHGDALAGQGAEHVDLITPHITDSHSLELPVIGEWEIPRLAPVHIGGLTIDLSPTKHVIMLLLAAFLCMVVLIPAARAHVRHTARTGAPRGFSAGLEAVVLYLRNEVVLPNVGPHGDAYVPFALSLFFFILFANLLGLVPYGSTATGNISVTAMLAIVSFCMIEIAGVRTQGWGYLRTIFYIPPKDMPWWLKPPMFVVMTIVEVIGKFTKPFALAVRLFANMTAGHVVLLALISLILTFGWKIFVGPVAMGVGISLLEIFVAFLQAYIFTILTCVFIGLMRSHAH